jgi:hypothetical protein
MSDYDGRYPGVYGKGYAAATRDLASMLSELWASDNNADYRRALDDVARKRGLFTETRLRYTVA